jgi:hypothetical protein
MKATTRNRLLRLAGLLVFAAAFALPAIRVADPGQPPSTQSGWVCAVFATAANGSLAHLQDTTPYTGDRASSLLLALSGWANPLFLLYLALCLWPHALRLRQALAILVLVSFVASWIFFARLGFTPLAGHFLWVAGPLLAFAPEVLDRFLDRKLIPPPAA